MKLSTDKEHLVLNHLGLVHYLVHKAGITQESSEYEDVVSTGTLGLIKAAITFDTSRNVHFPTYATRCIQNEIFVYFRKAKKYMNNISLDAPIETEVTGRNLSLVDLIEDSSSNFVEKMASREDLIFSVCLILNYLKERERLVMLYRIGNLQQQDIADMLHISQSGVSRIASRAALKIQEFTNHPKDYEEIFSITPIGDKYRISFSTKDTHKFNEIFAALLQNSTLTEHLPDFRINCSQERVILQLPTVPESFSLIAQIIQKMDDYHMTFISNKRTASASNIGN